MEKLKVGFSGSSLEIRNDYTDIRNQERLLEMGHYSKGNIFQLERQVAVYILQRVCVVLTEVPDDGEGENRIALFIKKEDLPKMNLNSNQQGCKDQIVPVEYLPTSNLK